MTPDAPHVTVLRNAFISLAVIAILSGALWLASAATDRQIALLVTVIAAAGTGLAVIQVLKALRRPLTLEISSPARAAAVRSEPAALPPPQMPATAAVSPEYGWRLWFERCVSAAQGSRVRTPEAFAHYQQWAAANGIEETVPLQTFGRLMTDRIAAIGGKILQSNGRVYEGISLADLGERAIPLMQEGT